ncbi:kinase-like protein [Lentinus brumalis]|uniref:Kinase-like protein n=1 Tax=Lentinus brumalis TaxID=2498619 RepID=A0A371DPT2_9APHY|nr:kinase-like protein [Polyporus brumalis]
MRSALMREGTRIAPLVQKAQWADTNTVGPPDVNVQLTPEQHASHTPTYSQSPLPDVRVRPTTPLLSHRLPCSDGEIMGVLALLFEVYLLCRQWHDPDSLGRVMFLPFRLVLKIGKDSAGAEADTLRFVRKHTTIPVPRVYISARGFGRTYTLMEDVRGDELQFMWVDMSTEQQSLVLDQLRDYIQQLRKLQPPPCVPPGAVCSLCNKALRDGRITSGRPLGPFANEAAFNDCVVEVAEPFMDPSLLPRIRARMRDDHRIVFTHGDLAPRNILVQGHRVVAIIDWEESGWYPEHWELVKALWYPGFPKKNTSWVEGMKDVVGREHEADYRIDCELSKHMIGMF